MLKNVVIFDPDNPQVKPMLTYKTFAK